MPGLAASWPPPPTEGSTTPRRARVGPRSIAPIQTIREIWILREQAPVRLAQKRSLAQLQRVLEGAAGGAPGPSGPVGAAGRSRSRSRSAERAQGRPPAAPQEPSERRRNPAPAPTAPAADAAAAAAATAAERPARERADAVRMEVERLRARRGVTGLSPEFRERLEGRLGERGREGARGRGRGERVTRWTERGGVEEVGGLRVVTGVLEGGFRHQLEELLVRRDEIGRRRRRREREREMAMQSEGAPAPSMEGETGGGLGGGRVGGRIGGRGQSLERLVMDLAQEVAILKNVVRASFDVQLDVQRSIRQEVSAAMNKGGVAGGAESKERRSDEDGPVLAKRAFSADDCKPMSGGCCCVCLEASIDSLLYSCGHMCTCSMCGRQLMADGLACPICRAPVRDVVRAFIVGDHEYTKKD